MDDSLILAGVKYISSKQASKMTSYAKDYIGQMCRAGKIDARLVGRSWYVSERSLLKHQERTKGERTVGDREHWKRGEEMFGRVHVSEEKNIPLYHVAVDERPLNPEPKKEVFFTQEEVEKEEKKEYVHANETPITITRPTASYIQTRNSFVQPKREERKYAPTTVKPKVKEGRAWTAVTAVVVLVLIVSMLFQSRVSYTAESDEIHARLEFVRSNVLANTIAALHEFPNPFK